MAQDYYALLGVNRDAGNDELKKAYRSAFSSQSNFFTIRIDIN